MPQGLKRAHHTVVILWPYGIGLCVCAKRRLQDCDALLLLLWTCARPLTTLKTTEAAKRQAKRDRHE